MSGKLGFPERKFKILFAEYPFGYAWHMAEHNFGKVKLSDKQLEIFQKQELKSSELTMEVKELLYKSGLVVGLEESHGLKKIFFLFGEKLKHQVFFTDDGSFCKWSPVLSGHEKMVITDGMNTTIPVSTVRLISRDLLQIHEPNEAVVFENLEQLNAFDFKDYYPEPRVE